MGTKNKCANPEERRESPSPTLSAVCCLFLSLPLSPISRARRLKKWRSNKIDY